MYLVPGVYLVQGVCLCSRGVYLFLGGVPGPGGCTCLGGVPVPGRGVPGPGGIPGPGGVPAQVLPPVNRMTDRCKNIGLLVKILRILSQEANQTKQVHFIMCTF